MLTQVSLFDKTGIFRDYLIRDFNSNDLPKIGTRVQLNDIDKPDIKLYLIRDVRLVFNISQNQNDIDSPCYSIELIEIGA